MARPRSRTHTRAHTHSNTHTHTLTHIHTHWHTYTDTHTHIGTPTRPRTPPHPSPLPQAVTRHTIEEFSNLGKFLPLVWNDLSVKLARMSPLNPLPMMRILGGRH